MRRARTVVAAVVVASISAAAYAAPAAPAPAAADAAPARPTITRSAHVAFANCNARHIVLSVTAPRHAFTLTKPVTVTVRLRNTGSTTCGTPLAPHVPQARSALTVGPCGILSLTVRNSGGADVYPGPATYFCPDESGLRLGPHSTAQATGYWSQAAYLGSPPKPQHAPPGTYRLIVDRAVTVPVTLAPG